jgi:hypothetical protein
MIAGTTLEELSQRILTENERKRDYIADTRRLRFVDTGRLVLENVGEFVPTPHCNRQIANRVGIPSRYYERMVQEAPSLLATNVNHWFQKAPETRMIRTLSGSEPVARAFLSDRYRPFDNAPLLNNVLPYLFDKGFEIKSCELTPKRLYVQAVTPKIQAEVVGDVVQAGILLRNSEVGSGSFAVEPLIYTLRCTNGMVLPQSLRRRHIGRNRLGDMEEEDIVECLSDETRALEDKAFWAKVRDVVAASVDETKFHEAVGRLATAKQITVPDVVKTVEEVTERYNLSEQQKDGILNHLAAGGDVSLYGLANAVTRTAQDQDDYEAAINLERIGGDLIASQEVWSRRFGAN